jgi:hypothetical protein
VRLDHLLSKENLKMKYSSVSEVDTS